MTIDAFGVPEVALQLLQSDMQRLEDRMRDDKFARELYRALAENRWTKDRETAALSWRRAEELINVVRRGLGAPPLVLAETGGEGIVDRSVREAFEPLGWRIEPLDTSRSDPAHLSSRADPPPDEAALKRLRFKR
jgi:hypothetical protein